MNREPQSSKKSSAFSLAIKMALAAFVSWISGDPTIPGVLQPTDDRSNVTPDYRVVAMLVIGIILGIVGGFLLASLS
jgi:hypothetical protein